MCLVGLEDLDSTVSGKRELQASDFILSTIQHRYQFPFISVPPSSYCKNNKSFFEHRDFAYNELLRLESLGCIRRVKEQPYFTLPLSVVYSKKYRLVFDASRHLKKPCKK